jgi:NADH-quinone oxidoreductase subunit H
MALKAVVVLGALLVTLLYMQWVERKVIAHIQRRLGPYRVGPHGLLQPVADTLKLMLKEDLLPSHVNRILYLLAPFLAVTLALISIAVIPFGPEIEVAGVRTWIQLTDLNVGVLFVLAISSLTVYAVVLAGWSSNSKYPLLGGLRAAAQMVGYELPLGMAVAAPLLMSGSLSLREIVLSQETFHGLWPGWNIFRLPFPQLIGFLVFMVAAFAETNRIPFDLPEAENELVAGFHTEYSGFRWCLFFMAEYGAMFAASGLAVTLFLGGWHTGLFPASWMPGDFTSPLGVLATVLSVLVFIAKSWLLVVVMMWVRWTLPRLRIDQVMMTCMKYLIPLSCALLLFAALLPVVWNTLKLPRLPLRNQPAVPALHTPYQPEAPARAH